MADTRESRATWSTWYAAQDALIAVDHAVAQLPGASAQSGRVAGLIRTLRAEVEAEIVLACRAAEEAA